MDIDSLPDKEWAINICNILFPWCPLLENEMQLNETAIRKIVSLF